MSPVKLWQALPTSPDVLDRHGSPDRPCGRRCALRPQSIHEPCPFRGQRGHPCWQSRAASRATSKRNPAALCVLRYSRFILLLTIASKNYPPHRLSKSVPTGPSGPKPQVLDKLEVTGEALKGTEEPCAAVHYSRAGRSSEPLRIAGLFRLLRNVTGRQCGTLAEEEIFHVLGDQVLRFLLPRH
jgi:hypothetical protein